MKFFAWGNFLGAIAFLAIMAAPVAKSAPAPVWVAHRGGNVETDENTLGAYRLAAQSGMQFVECDPRPTKDGVLVTMHDPTVDRTTNGKGKVRDQTLREIKALRTPRGDQVPTIEEILTFAKSAGVGVYLDTKLKNDAYMQNVMDLVVKTGMEKHVIVGLWHTDQLKWMHKNYPRIETCISWPAPLQSLAHAKKLGASLVGTIVPLATKSMIACAHKNGIKVITLQINDLKTIRQKIDAGIDAIQTDNPGLKKQFGP